MFCFPITVIAATVITISESVWEALMLGKEKRLNILLPEDQTFLALSLNGLFFNLSLFTVF